MSDAQQQLRVSADRDALQRRVPPSVDCSAELLGELLEQAGERTGQVPAELWRELAEAAVRVAAAAQMLAGDADDDPTA